MTVHIREHKNIRNLETSSEVCFACGFKVEWWLGKLQLWTSSACCAYTTCSHLPEHPGQAAAGAQEVSCFSGRNPTEISLVFILSVGSWGTDMKQVKALKPDLTSRAVAFDVFMSWEPPKHSQGKWGPLCGILKLIDDNWLMFLN